MFSFGLLSQGMGDTAGTFTSGTCSIQPVSSGSTLLPGANTITINGTISATTSVLTFTSPFTIQGQHGVAILRSAGTCNMTIIITEIRSSNGTVLWSPEIDSTEIIFPDNIEFQSDTIVWSMGFMIFLMAVNTWYVIIRKR